MDYDWLAAIAKGYETGNMTSDSVAKNIDIKGQLCKTSGIDFEALDDIKLLPRNKDAPSPA